MREIQAPFNIPNKGRKLFLAGSIEMGAAELWQERVVEALKDTDWLILNPRRADWDSSWTQSIENDKFREQVEWELQGLECADSVLFYIDPKTKSPITLLEIGLVAGYSQGIAANLFPGMRKNMLVVCPDGFYRKGNVDIVCDRYGLTRYTSLDSALLQLQLAGKAEKN